jgi:hypothetical protein
MPETLKLKLKTNALKTLHAGMAPLSPARGMLIAGKQRCP